MHAPRSMAPVFVTSTMGSGLPCPAPEYCAGRRVKSHVSTHKHVSTNPRVNKMVGSALLGTACKSAYPKTQEKDAG